ncbi:MAG: adenosylmethionine--8-amino-7-oxononanoate transaminase [Bdellovibrionota bacterium]
MSNNTQSLQEMDHEFIWHPYSQHGSNQDILPVISAKGAYLTLENGREILDAISSWWVNIHGHAHPTITEAIATQAKRIDHVMFAGFTHAPAVELARILVTATRARGMRLDRVFYSDNGSTAVEVALKMAFQYHYNRGDKTRTRFIALRGSYHGDTLGAMAVGEPEGFHTQFRRLLTEVDFVTPGNISELEELIAKNSESHAAFIFEPMVQGASGMQMYPAAYLEAAVYLCKKHRVLTIADEVFTGFYRTGKCLASEHARLSPDLFCLSKGITGGILPLAVTLASEEIFDAFLSKDLSSAFLHGHSYTANPIACAAAIASWKLLQTPKCLSRIEEITSVTHQSVQRLKTHPKVAATRSLGTIGAIELNVPDGYFSDLGSKLLRAALERNVLLRPLGRVVYAVPPYCTTPDEVRRIYNVMEEIIDEL